MKRILNTLYITNEDARLNKQGETVVVKIENEVKLRVPIHTIQSVICFGRVACSTPFLTFCASRNIQLCFLSRYGRFQARVAGPTQGNVLLRRAQYRCTDCAEITLAIARDVISAKIANSRTQLLRALRDRGENVQLSAAAETLRSCLRRARRCDELAQVRGVEGEAARAYFGAFDAIMTRTEPEFRFERRTRRPPKNPANALLSFLYALLLGDCVGALESVGLDPAVGYLHRERPGRPSAALDLCEEFRPVLADRVAFTLLNRKQLNPRDFSTDEAGAVLLSGDARKLVLIAWQQRKQEVIRHPYLDERMELGIVIHQQARLLAQRIRGELDAYPGFIWR